MRAGKANPCYTTFVLRLYPAEYTSDNYVPCTDEIRTLYFLCRSKNTEKVQSEYSFSGAMPATVSAPGGLASAGRWDGVGKDATGRRCGGGQGGGGTAATGVRGAGLGTPDGGGDAMQRGTETRARSGRVVGAGVTTECGAREDEWTRGRSHMRREA